MLVSVQAARPPRRFDALSWTGVIGEWSASPSGPWTSGPEQPTGPDSDPANPAARGLTFDVVLDVGYLRLVFSRGAQRGAPTEPTPFGSAAVQTLDVAELRERTLIDLAGFDDDRISRTLLAATTYVEQVTGRIPLTTVSTELAPLAADAIQLRVEQLLLSRTSEAVSAQVNPSGRISYSAPGWSETRADPSRVQVRGDVLNPWPALHELLWLLMTGERRQEWLEQINPDAPDAPAFTIADVDVPAPELGWTDTGYWG